MNRPRHRLPLHALRAFEAAARTLSFKDAANELGVTPASVSNQIRQLERDWACLLFVRKTRRVELTATGQTLARAMARAFDDIQSAIDSAHLPGLQTQQNIRLAVGPLFGARWLAPRLTRFYAAHPEIRLQLSQASPIHTPQQLQTDAAIDWGTGPWPGLEALPLFDCWLAPVLSPRLLALSSALRQPQDLLHLPVLHQQSGADWAAWMALAGVPSARFAQETVMADANMALQAALDAQGVALGVFPLVQADVDAGRLVCPWDLRLHTGQSYHLLLAHGGSTRAPTRALWDWLRQEAAQATP